MSTRESQQTKRNSRRDSSSIQRQNSASKTNQKKNNKSISNDKSPEIERKKSLPGESKTHLTLFSDKIFKHDKEGYMKTFIKADKNNKFQAVCQICDGETFLAQYANQHIQIRKHKENTDKLQGKRGLDKLEKLILAVTTKKKKVDQRSKLSKEEQEHEGSKKYLEFIAFALSQKLSFLQISRLGRFLKEMLNRKDGVGLNFFQWHNFDRDMISKIAVDCFRPYLIDELKENLKEKKFSFSIDASTVAGENLCALKVRFLEKELLDEENELRTRIRNQVIGIQKLGQSSNAPTFLEIAKEKIFLDDPQIKQNLIGITTDRASTLTGEESGLIALLKKEVSQNIFVLPDPCHSLSLIIKHSLKLLPDNVRSFISNIHNYFTSPQRREKLKAVQKENSHKILMPLNYVKTRWLSLGNSLSRLIEIWPSLQIYMNTYSGEKGVRCSQVINSKPEEDVEIAQLNYKEISTLLNDESFYVKIAFLSLIINRINHYNIVFQNQGLDIAQLKYQIYECFAMILELVIIPSKLDLQDLKKYFTINWPNLENHEIWFLDSEDLVKKLQKEHSQELSKLRNLTSAQQEAFTKTFQIFIAKILDLMIFYLPLEGSIIDSFDFIHALSDFSELSSKALHFNNYFNIVDDSQIGDLKKEIVKLTSRRRSKYEQGTSDILHIWDRIEQDNSENFKFTLLPKLVNAAQSLPTSSSDVEQTFSGVKLIKTLLRNRLSVDKVEAILLILQSYGGKQKIVINEKLLFLLKEVEEKFYEKKKTKIRASDMKRDSFKQVKHNEEEVKENYIQEKIYVSLNSSQNEIENEEVDREVIWDNISTIEERIETEVWTQDVSVIEIETTKT